MYLIYINLIISIIDFENLRDKLILFLSCTIHPLLHPFPQPTSDSASILQLSPEITNDVHLMCTFWMFLQITTNIFAYVETVMFYLNAF